MILLYIDDSGSIDDKDQSHFCLAGIAVYENHLKYCNDKINELKKQYRCENLEIHTKDMIGRHGGGLWRKVDEHIREQVLHGLCNIIKDIRLPSVCFGVVIDKSSYVALKDIYNEAYTQLISRFQMFLSNQYYYHKKMTHSSYGMIVMDNNKYHNQTTNITNLLKQYGTQHNLEITRIIETPLFVDSKQSNLVQLADFVAHSLNRKYAKNIGQYYDIICGKFYRKDNEMHGLKIISAKNYNAK